MAVSQEARQQSACNNQAIMFVHSVWALKNKLLVRVDRNLLFFILLYLNVVQSWEKTW